MWPKTFERKNEKMIARVPLLKTSKNEKHFYEQNENLKRTIEEEKETK